jgi:hypothetical protein
MNVPYDIFYTNIDHLGLIIPFLIRVSNLSYKNMMVNSKNKKAGHSRENQSNGYMDNPTQLSTPSRDRSPGVNQA